MEILELEAYHGAYLDFSSIRGFKEIVEIYEFVDPTIIFYGILDKAILNTDYKIIKRLCDEVACCVPIFKPDVQKYNEFKKTTFENNKKSADVVNTYDAICAKYN